MLLDIDRQSDQRRWLWVSLITGVFDSCVLPPEFVAISHTGLRLWT